MKIGTFLLATLLAAVPAFAFAMGGGCKWGHHSEQATSCADGMTYDDSTGTCVSVATG